MKSSHSASSSHHFRTCSDREHHVFTHCWLFLSVRKLLLKRCANGNGGVYLLCEFNFGGDQMKLQRQLDVFFQCSLIRQFKFSISQGPDLLFVYLAAWGVWSLLATQLIRHSSISQHCPFLVHSFFDFLSWCETDDMTCCVSIYNITLTPDEL